MLSRPRPAVTESLSSVLLSSERAANRDRVGADDREGSADRAEGPFGLEFPELPGSARATAGTDPIAMPTPSATASAPMRPT